MGIIINNKTSNVHHQKFNDIWEFCQEHGDRLDISIYHRGRSVHYDAGSGVEIELIFDNHLFELRIGDVIKSYSISDWADDIEYDIGWQEGKQYCVFDILPNDDHINFTMAEELETSGPIVADEKFFEIFN